MGEHRADADRAGVRGSGVILEGMAPPPSVARTAAFFMTAGPMPWIHKGNAYGLAGGAGVVATGSGFLKNEKGDGSLLKIRLAPMMMNAKTNEATTPTNRLGQNVALKDVTSSTRVLIAFTSDRMD